MQSINPGLLATLSYGFKKNFIDGVQRAALFYNNIAMTLNSTNAAEIYPTLGKIPTLREWVGDRVANDLTIYDFMIKNKAYEGTVRVPRPAIEDDSFGIYSNMSTMLGDAAARFPDKLVFALLESGWTATCYDGATFFSTTHPYAGGTQSNKGTTAFSSAAYAAARAQMMSLKDDGGELLGITPSLLMVPPGLEEAARLVLNAQFVPNTAGTATQSNIWNGSAHLVVNPRLTDVNDWYLIDDTKPIMPIIWQTRKAPQLVAKTSLTDDNVFSRNEFIWGVDLRGNAGFGLWQLIFGAHV